MASRALITATMLGVLLASTAQAVVGNASVLHQLENGTAGWPSLRFHFTIKRRAMQVHGQSDFDVLATPVGLANDDNNGSVLYDTFATFSDESTLYNYTLVDGMAFVTTSSNKRNGNVAPSVECAEQDMLPPINSIVSAINEAIPVSSISSSSSGTIDCRSGDTFKVSVNGIDFGLCFMGSSGFTLHGSDLDITVKYTERIEMPTIDGGVCNKVEAATLVTAIGKSFLTGEPINSRDARRLRAALFNLDFSFGDEACSCKSTPRPCIFIHGLGVKKEEPENLDIFPTRYWGNLTQDDAPCCTSMKYAMLNTVNNSWTSDEQQQKVCDRALAVSETSQGSTITDTIIITHSMGNLMLAGAIAKGMCSLDSSVSWVGLSGPMRGSMASNYFQDSCKNDTNFLAEDMAAKTGYCPADDGIISLAYEGESYSSPELDAAYAAAQKAYRSNVTALMCSNGFWGLRSERQWWYWVLGIVVPHKSSKNDGIVEFYSCAGGLPTSSFGNSYTDKFYVTKLNHADTAFRNGDALLNKAKMPVKWLECLL